MRSEQEIQTKYLEIDNALYGLTGQQDPVSQNERTILHREKKLLEWLLIR